MKVKVVDNFMPEDVFKEIQTIVTGIRIPWYHQERVVYDDDAYGLDTYILHTLFENNNSIIGEDRGVLSNMYNMFVPFLEKVGVNVLMRLKLNNYTRTDSIVEHKLHIDHPIEHKVCLWSINTNDGYTLLENGDKINSIENRALFFNSNVLHASTTCTDKKCRINVNLNYL